MTRSIIASLGLGVAVTLCAVIGRPADVAGFSLLGESLDLGQRDFRVFNNFLDAQANDNTTPHPNFPGQTGAPMAIWKAHVEWSSGPYAGNGLGDGVASNPNLGDGGANFDNTFQGLAFSGGGNNGNVHCTDAIGGAVIAFTTLPAADGWKITYNENLVWDDGPGAAGNGATDLQAIATHEIGHTLGLGHSSASGATMSSFVAGPVENARSIEADDIAGIQAIYGAKAASKPEISGLSGSAIVGGALTISGLDFSAASNEVWFTKEDSDGNPLKVFGAVSTGGGTSIDVIVPDGAVDGEVLVKGVGTGGASLSNAFPIDIAEGFEIVQPGVAGAAGMPLLEGAGDLTPGSPTGFTIETSSVLANASGILFASLELGAAPFKGGTFYPSLPPLLQFDIGVDGAGELVLAGQIPSGSPGGTQLVIQEWFSDAVAVKKVSGTNGLILTIP